MRSRNLCFAVAGLLLFGAGIRSSQASPIYVSGFNADEIYGAGETASTGISPTNGVDGSSYAFTGNGYVNGTNTEAAGLPASGTFTSATGSGIVWTLQPYAGMNDLRLTTGGNGTLTVVPGAYSALTVLATSGGNASNVTFTLNYNSGTPTVLSAQTVADWGAGGATAAIKTDRVKSGVLPGSGAWSLYEIPLAGVDSNRQLSSIGVHENSGGTLNVFAVDAVAAPEPATVGLALVGSFGLLLRRRTHRA